MNGKYSKIWHLLNLVSYPLTLDHVVFFSNKFGNLEGVQACVQWYMKTDSNITLRKSVCGLKDLQWIWPDWRTYFQPATQYMGFGWMLCETLNLQKYEHRFIHVYELYKMWWILRINNVESLYTQRAHCVLCASFLPFSASQTGNCS